MNAKLVELIYFTSRKKWANQKTVVDRHTNRWTEKDLSAWSSEPYILKNIVGIASTTNLCTLTLLTTNTTTTTTPRDMSTFKPTQVTGLAVSWSNFESKFLFCPHDFRFPAHIGSQWSALKQFSVAIWRRARRPLHHRQQRLSYSRHFGLHHAMKGRVFTPVSWLHAGWLPHAVYRAVGVK